MEIIKYRPIGVCSVLIQVAIENNVIKDMSFTGGCNGNLKGICALAKDMNINEVISRLKGINCNGKGTSCPDQLASCLLEYVKDKAAAAELKM